MALEAEFWLQVCLLSPLGGFRGLAHFFFFHIIDLLVTFLICGLASLSFILHHTQYPQKDKHNRYSLGPRTYMELSDIVREHVESDNQLPQLLYV